VTNQTNGSVHYKRVTRCRACGNAKLNSVLDLGIQALTGRFPRQGEADPPSAPLELVLCDTQVSGSCGLLQLAHTCDPNLMFGDTYGYRSSISNTMINHLHGTAERLMAHARVAPDDAVLEIGSNDGTIQRHLSGRGHALVAVDPSAAKFAHQYPADSKLIVDYFSRAAIDKFIDDRKFQAIISLSMFYDLEDPLSFMKDVRACLAKDGIWCFEQAYLPPTFTSLCYDSICHEHLTYYGVRQVEWLARAAGLKLIDVSTNDINGGSFCVYAARDDSSIPANAEALAAAMRLESDLKLDSIDTWKTFAGRVDAHRSAVVDFFDTAKAKQKLVLGLGASTKGNVMLQYAGITADSMPAIGERDPLKVGLRTPRTNIPIISEEDARKRKPDYFFVGPWHFRDEIIKRESQFVAEGGRIVFPLPEFSVIPS